MGDENTAPSAPSGAIVRQEFGAQQIAVQAETASAAVAAQARAAVEARYIMARHAPRDWDTVRVSLIKECTRPGFAAVARYHKPVGKGVEGPSIRFAEAALRAMTNVLPETSTIFDDDKKRIVRVSVTDLEANVTYTKDIVVEKVVERSRLRPGQAALSTRVNSGGQTVHLVAATEDDLLNKEAALASKALRGLALRLLPGDILEECMDAVVETLNNQAAKDPDAERKKLVDAFASLGVQPSDLKLYIGHDLGTVSPKEIVDLRAVFSALKDGEATWTEMLEHKGVAKKTDATDAPKTLGDLTKRKEAHHGD